jgi:hypothetical protein
MSGQLARLEDEIEELRRVYDEIKLIRVILKCDLNTGKISDEEKENAKQKVYKCQSFVQRCQRAAGEIHTLTLPSGRLVEAREKWLDYKKELDEYINRISYILDGEVDILSLK